MGKTRKKKSKKQRKMKVTTTQVFLYVPNIIGYLRIILVLFSLVTSLTSPFTTVGLYMSSRLLDAFDGYFARELNQFTKFGAMLDLLTDCTATSMLLMTLSVLFPHYLIWFQISMGLDIVSHWLHCHVTLELGKTSHKLVSEDTNIVLRIYYSSKKVLFGMCAGNEIFYNALYLSAFTSMGGLIPIITACLFPVALLKSFISLVQLYYAAKDLAAIDAENASKK